jgi:hypothetical protein
VITQNNGSDYTNLYHFMLGDYSGIFTHQHNFPVCVYLLLEPNTGRYSWVHFPTINKVPSKVLAL